MKKLGFFTWKRPQKSSPLLSKQAVALLSAVWALALPGGSQESLESSDLSAVCFMRFVTGLVMAARIPCSSPFIVILQICSVFSFLLT